MLRALALALYLLFPSDEGKLGIEAIGSKQLHRGIKLLKQKPVVSGFGDMPLSLLFILHELSPFLVAQGMRNTAWIGACCSVCHSFVSLTINCFSVYIATASSCVQA